MSIRSCPHSYESAQLYPAYQANVHERRLAAKVCRAVPLVLFLLTLVVSVIGALRWPFLLLVVAAVLNTTFWIYLFVTSMCAILGIRWASWEIQSAPWVGPPDDSSLQQEPLPEPLETPAGQPSVPASDEEAGRSSVPAEAGSDGDIAAGAQQRFSVSHLIVLPNYKEDEEMLAVTLKSLSEASGSRDFRIVLGMEAREGPSGAEKGARLCERFGPCFRWCIVSSHPGDLLETHIDGSSDAEVPGKASNLKWAVRWGYEQCRAEASLDVDSVVVTVADADCIFHPCYFAHISKDYSSEEFRDMRLEPGSRHIYTMWQAPQLAFRNFYQSPMCSRTWGELAGADEYGGVSGLACGFKHMVFSSYSLTLRLAVEAAPWDGDVIAEDHHCYLRCFFYSVYAAVLDSMNSKAGAPAVPALHVRPVFLPVKSTSVISSEGYWATCWERWEQAKRHMRGVSELSYALLAAYDTVRTLPFDLWNFRLALAVLRCLGRVLCMHMLPNCQTVALGVVSIYWFLNNQTVPMCPHRLILGEWNNDSVMLCGLAGAWVLVWPVVIPLILFGIANYLFLVVAFVKPSAMKHRSIWHMEDGGTPPLLGSVRLRLALVISFDLFVSMIPCSFLYAFVPELMAYWNVCVDGNRIKYVTASKALTAEGSEHFPSYGSTQDASSPAGKDHKI